MEVKRIQNMEDDFLASDFKRIRKTHPNDDMYILVYGTYILLYSKTKNVHSKYALNMKTQTVIKSHILDIHNNKDKCKMFMYLKK